MAVAALGTCVAAAAVSLPFAASANLLFQQQTGQPCGACHLPGQELRAREGLNPAGIAFMNCGYKLGCNAPAAPATSETKSGLALLKNQCQPGQTQFVVLRPGDNDPARNLLIMLEPGQHVRVVVLKGTS